MKKPKTKLPLKNEFAPAIKNSDQKILWSRAAGRCSICRKSLTIDTQSKKTLTLGEMCHIVGEAINGPRGKSLMPVEVRSSYQNLILLCSHHHDEIDKNVDDYPIEILHQLKANHELWVAESLGKEQDTNEIVYANLIDMITERLQLESWVWFIDNAVRDLLHEDFLEVRTKFAPVLIGSVLPKKKPKLAIAIREVVKAFCSYINHYETHAEPSLRGDFFRADRSYKRTWLEHSEYERREAQISKWSHKNFLLLCEYVIKLNNFARAVRKFHNPLYFRIKGDFLIHDSLGYRFGGKSTIFNPSEKDIKRMDRILDQSDSL